MRAPWWFVPLIVSCRHEAPSVDPLEYLAVGVDPSIEARAVEDGLVHAGFVVRTRIVGTEFVAIDADQPSEGATAVRIVTHRGTALGLDAPDGTTPFRERVSLVAGQDGSDLDGDGRPELAIEIVDARFDSTCIALVRVVVDDTVREVSLPAREFGERACAERIEDVGGSDRPEALVRWRFTGVEGLDASVLVPFTGEGGRWARMPHETADAFYERELAARRAALVEARRRRDRIAELRLATEAAMILQVRGRDAAEQRAAFDEWLGSVAPDDSRAALADRVRAAIEAGFPAP